ncbi:MAG: hypothetical protein KJ950_15065 [Proteobacteria bacterium]|nr:hypothetical protein [Pseudomonadota bacterium]MBU1688656.1 hypothetical protein [Pseudomonadota bacterium]
MPTDHLTSPSQIIFPDSCRQEMINHCRRKLAREFIEGEAQELKAFGLLAGNREGDRIQVGRCLPLLRNVRSQLPHRQFMDEIMTAHAIPSITPLDRRGWVADPAELMEKVRDCHQNHFTLVGTYHMHRVAWPDDATRDTPTTLDMILGQESRLIMFIVSMVSPKLPIIRAFSEGRPDREIPIFFEDS